MQNPHNHPSLYGHSVYGTTVALTSSDGLIHSEEDTYGNSQSAIDASLSFNLPSTFPPQNQAFPVLGQLISHHQVDASRAGILKPSLPFGLDAHNTSASYPIRPQNTVNINIIMGSNSSININLLSAKPPSHLGRQNPFANSSSTPPLRNHVYDPASLNLQQPYVNQVSNQGPIPNRIPETKMNPQFTRYHSQHTSPIAATVGKTPSSCVTDYEQKIPTAIPCLGQNTVKISPHQGGSSQPCQRIPSQNRTISHSKMGLSFLKQSYKYLPGEKHNRLPALPSSTLNLRKHVVVPDGENGTFHNISIHPQPHLPTSPESHPASEQITKQAPEPIFNCIPFPQREPLQPLSEVTPRNDNKTTKIEVDPQARRRRLSSMRHKSHPYQKYGPYTCPQCHVVFESGHRFAAHVKTHYKDETPFERKKRRERKIKNRDLHIAESTNGMTVMPGSLEDEPLFAAYITDGKANESNQREDFAYLSIKKEV
ncbi:hypothetical protein BVRB_4g071640 [Beta vulgaris subsp. vulgaris]|nr:hypothetical protein BVRB_4g071640 [Beta vulgaris subsp. vulgaris]